MEPTQIAKQTLGFQKTIFDNSSNAITMVQDQSEKLLTGYIDKLPWVPEESKKYLQTSMDMAKQARSDFKKAVDDGFAKLEELLEEN